MKENRLIELLNEYDSGFEYRAYNGKIQRRIRQSKNKRFSVWWNSKSFGFIQRLVRENKIDLGKIKKLYRKSNENSTATYPILYDYTYDESLLMFLAIQDNPLEFLISVLK